MKGAIQLTSPFDKAAALDLRAGQEVLLSGRVLTARDAAHRRLCECLDHGQPLPVDVTDQVIYFVGPTPARPGRALGAAGPTTSSRMDSYSPILLAAGLRAMIGKGYRGRAVREALRAHGAVHFSAMGGLGALLGKCVKRATVLAYEDLGPEAIRELIVEALPLIVAYDAYGQSAYPQEQDIV